MKKNLENMSISRLRTIAHAYKVENAEGKDRETLIEEIYSLSIKVTPVDKDGNPLKLPR